MHFATTLTLISALILSGSSVLAIPVPATETISNDITSLAARDLSYKSTVEARGFDFEDLTLEERGLSSGLQKLKNKIMGGSSAPPVELPARAFDFDSLALEERGLRSGLRNLKNKVMGGSSAAPSTGTEVQRREVEEELLERDRVAGTSLGRLRVQYIRRSLSGADLRRREELVQRGLRTALRNLKDRYIGGSPSAADLRRRELEREIVGRGQHWKSY